jgi:putative two-component system response regulator
MNETSRILIVDDEKRSLHLMESILVPLGHEVIMAKDGEEALDMAQTLSPDIILLDIMMPRLNGFEVLRRLKQKEETRIIPIVIVTGLGGIEHRVKALELGADDFLTKPFETTELKARIKSFIKVKAYNDHMRHYQKKLESEVNKRTDQLRKAFDEIKTTSLDTIHRLSRAAEYRDEDTGDHIFRISNYSAAIAKEMGLNEKTEEAILYSAPMHDVGKIGVPDQILLKPGKLTKEEFETMKTHTVIGGQILDGASKGFIRLGEIIALTHHERWNGTGYPKGLRGSEIPLVGRIVAIADVFDALTSKRPYKEPFPVEKSFEIIKEKKGIHFDPGVVNAFFSIKDEILSIKKRFKDREGSLLMQISEKLSSV